MKVKAEEAEDFWYFWRIAGQILGLDPAAIPPDVAHAKLFVERLKERHWAKSNEGIELTKSLLKLYTSMVPGAGLFDGIVPAVLRFLAGDVVCDILEVPKSRWTRVVEGNRVMFRLIQALQEKSSTVNDFVNTMGLKILSHEAIRIGGGRRAEFQIPGELRRAWCLPPYGSTLKTLAVVRELSQGWRGQDSAYLLDLAVLVASADGEIDDIEAEALTEVVIAVTDARDPAKARASIKTNVRALRESGPSVRLHSVSEALRTSQKVEEGLQLAIALAYANSGIAKEERSLIEALAQLAGVTPTQLEALVGTTCARIEATPAS